jgi:hypothetical protein
MVGATGKATIEHDYGILPLRFTEYKEKDRIQILLLFFCDLSGKRRTISYS